MIVRLLMTICCVLIGQSFAQNIELDSLRNQIVIPVGAICEGRHSAFFMAEDKQIIVSNPIVYRAVTQTQCLRICADNRDINGQSVICASVVFEEDYSVCKVYRVKAMPDGVNPLIDAQRTLYFEKFCLPASAPQHCANSLFRRVAQRVLVGFARNVTITNTAAQCAHVCMNEEFNCKSAAYFYEAGECITNTADAYDQPDALLPESVDKVVYLENGCLQGSLENSIGGNNLAVINEGQSATKQQTKTLVTKAATEAPTTTTTLRITTTKRKTTTPFVEDPSDTSIYTKWSSWSNCDRPDGRRVRSRSCRGGGSCANTFQSQWCADLDLTTTTTTTPKPTAQPTKTTTVAPTTTTPTPFNQQGWGAWTRTCVPFNDGQTCADSMLIGFQTRTCQGSPFQCAGPFFRYCTIPC